MEKRYIGLDLGTTTLGISISDSLGIVHGKENYCFNRGNYRAARIHLLELVKKENIYDIVIGLPLQLDRKEGERCKSVRRFIDDLKKEEEKINVVFYDESFSTLEAKERLERCGFNYKQTKERIDMMSAVIILEDYLRSIKK